MTRPDDLRRLAADSQTEAELQAAVIDLGTLLGWRVMHVRRSRVRDDRHATATSIAGWPDTFFFHPDRGEHFVAEMKSARGQLRPEQRDVLADLEASGVEVHVWRPKDWDAIEARLRGAR